MNRSIFLSIFFFFSCSSNDNSLQEHSILHDDVMRTFFTYVPSNIRKIKKDFPSFKATLNTIPALYNYKL